MLTASDQHYLSYVRKIADGGDKLSPPPPSRIGLQKEKSIIHNYIFNKSFLAVYCFEIQPNQRMPFMFIFKGPLLSLTN